MWKNFEQVRQEAIAIGGALKSLGFNKGDFVGVMSQTRYAYDAYCITNISLFILMAQSGVPGNDAGLLFARSRPVLRVFHLRQRGIV